MPAAKAGSEQAKAPDLLVLALDIIATTGWRGFTFTELAERANLQMTDIRTTFSGRSALLDALNQRLDQAMLAVEPDDMETLPPRDRVFEMMMSRIEAMAPFRAGLCRLIKDARFDPGLMAMTACRLDRSLAWLQDAADLAPGRGASPLKDVRKRLQRHLFGAVYLRTLNVWSSDDSRDLAKTMAFLDKQLRRIENLAGLAPRGEARATAEATA